MKFSEFFAAVSSALNHDRFLWAEKSEFSALCLDMIHDCYSLAMTDSFDCDVKGGDVVDVWPSHIASTANRIKFLSTKDK